MKLGIHAHHHNTHTIMKALFKSIQEEFVNQRNMLLHRNDDPDIMQAVHFKELGNQCLSEEFFDEAIMYYTKSIVSFTDQSLCCCYAVNMAQKKQGQKGPMLARFSLLSFKNDN